MSVNGRDGGGRARLSMDASKSLKKGRTGVEKARRAKNYSIRRSRTRREAARGESHAATFRRPVCTRVETRSCWNSAERMAVITHLGQIMDLALPHFSPRSESFEEQQRERGTAPLIHGNTTRRKGFFARKRDLKGWIRRNELTQPEPFNYELGRSPWSNLIFLKGDTEFPRFFLVSFARRVARRDKHLCNS